MLLRVLTNCHVPICLMRQTPIMIFSFIFFVRLYKGNLYIPLYVWYHAVFSTLINKQCLSTVNRTFKTVRIRVICQLLYQNISTYIHHFQSNITGVKTYTSETYEVQASRVILWTEFSFVIKVVCVCGFFPNHPASPCARGRLSL